MLANAGTSGNLKKQISQSRKECAEIFRDIINLLEVQSESSFLFKKKALSICTHF
jgi:hypothetical protein